MPVELGTFVLFEGGQVEVAEEAVDLLDALATWLPLLALASFGGAVWLATDRRRGAAQIGIAIAIAMAVTLVVARISRGEVLGGIDLERRRDAADEVWDVVVGSLVRQTVAVLLVGLLVAFVAWVVGPSRRATWLRTTTREQLRAVREGPLEGRTPTGLVAFVRPRRRALQGWTLALAFLVLWLVPEATPGIVVLVAAVVLVVVLAIELVGGGPGTRAPTGPRDDETAQPPGGGTGVRS